MRASTIGGTMILASAIAGIIVASVKLSGQPNTLGLYPIAFLYFTFRYSAMAFGIFAPLTLIAFSIIPSTDRPNRNTRLPLIILAILMALVSGNLILPEFKQTVITRRAQQGQISVNDIDFIYDTRINDPQWSYGILTTIARIKNTPEWILRTISERSSEDFGILIQIADNPSCPKEVLWNLSRNPDIQISNAANRALQQR